MKHLITCAVLLSSLLTTALAASTLQITQPWIREAPRGAQVLAGYLTLENTGDQPVVVTGVRGDGFERGELHRSSIVDGMARMEKLDRIVIEAGQRLVFEPGGYHLMLFGPRTHAPSGALAELFLVYEDGSEQVFYADILGEQDAPRGNAADTDHSHHHDHAHDH